MVRIARHPERGRGGTRVSPARLCAYEVVRRVFEQGAYADLALEATASRADLDGRERALAQQLAYGTVQRRATLDYLITALANRPAECLDPPLVSALRLGLYQLAFLAGIPDHAAVDQTVELSKRGQGGGFRLANAVMRRATREAAELLEELTDDNPGDAAIRHSHPEWLVRAWWDYLGPEEANELLAQDNTAPETAVRANTLNVTAAELEDLLAAGGVEAERRGPAPEGLVLCSPLDLRGSDLFRGGALMPQSRGSMLVAHAVRPEPGERVLDLCAAPGAKTTHLAALMRGEGEVVSVEQRPERAAVLRETCARMGAACVRVVRGDAATGEFGGGYDRVLADPPCSNLGTLQSRPDARWRKTPAQVEELATAQRAILEAGARALRPGGELVYSTCTISPLENEDVVQGFLAGHPDFAGEDLAAEYPELRHPRAPRFLQTLPHRHGTDGFFVARLRREG